MDDVSFRQPVFLSVHLPCLHTDLFLPHYQQVNTDGCVCKVQQEQVIETSKRLLHSHYRLQLGFDYFRSAFFSVLGLIYFIIYRYAAKEQNVIEAIAKVRACLSSVVTRGW